MLKSSLFLANKTSNRYILTSLPSIFFTSDLKTNFGLVTFYLLSTFTKWENTEVMNLTLTFLFTTVRQCWGWVAGQCVMQLPVWGSAKTFVNYNGNHHASLHICTKQMHGRTHVNTVGEILGQLLFQTSGWRYRVKLEALH